MPVPESQLAVEALLRHIGEDPLREGLRETPRRFVSALEELTGGYRIDVGDLLTTFDAEGYDEIVLVRGIPVRSLCEHHLLPFLGHAHVAYLPGRRIVGLSKLARVVDAYARRLQVQERLTMQVANAINEHLEPRGVAVVIEAEHSCMAIRGVRAPAAVTTTSVMLGVFRDKPESRSEVLRLMGT